jgi:hypothetical protein
VAWTDEAGALISPGLDRFVDSYVDWLEEEDAVRAAYEHWMRASEPDRLAAFLSYQAVLDREERAGAAYQASCDRLEHTPRRRAA